MTPRGGWAAWIALAIVALTVGCSDTDLEDLDLAEWRDPGASSDLTDGETTRQRLTDELLDCDCLKGQTKATILRTLGPPESRQALSERSRRRSVRILPGAPDKVHQALLRTYRAVERGSVELFTYTLGICTEKRNCLFVGDTEYLDLYFGREGRVAKVDVYGT